MRPLFVISFLMVTLIGCRESAEAPKPPSSQPQEAGSSAIGVLQKLRFGRPGETSSTRVALFGVRDRS